MAIKNNYPSVRPSLDLNFAGSRTVDPRITFTRASTATYYDGKTVAKAEENLLLSSNNLPLTAIMDTTRTNNSAVAPDGTTTAFTLIPNTNSTLHSSGYYSSSASAIAALSGENTVLSFYAKASGYKNLRLGNASLNNCFVTYDLDALTVSGTGGANFVSATIVDAGSGWRRLTVVYNNTATSLAFTFCPFPDGATVDVYGAATFAGDGTSGMLFWGFQAERRSNNTATAYTPTTDQPITRYQPVLLTAPANTPRIDHDPITGECKGLLVEQSRTNLLTYSEQFDNAAWAKFNSSVSANVTVAPDGTLTAYKLVENVANNISHSLQRPGSTTVGVTQTLTVYVKSAERSQIATSDAGAGRTLFDLASGTIISTASGSTAVISPAGNGWYRISDTRAWQYTTPYITLVNNGTHTYTGDGYSGIYVWGAQLETGAFPTSYIKTEASQVTRAADNASMTGTNFSSWYRQDEGTLVWSGSRYVGNTTALVDVNDGTTANQAVYFYNNVSETFSTAVVRSRNIATLAKSLTSVTTGKKFKIASVYKTDDFGAVQDGGSAGFGSSGPVPAVDRLMVGRNANAVYGSQHIVRIAYYPKRLSNQQLQALTL